MKTQYKLPAIILGLFAIACLQGCIKENNVYPYPNPTGTGNTGGTLRCTINNTPFTATSVQGAMYGAYGSNATYVITATYSSIPITQIIVLQFNADAIGTYTLGAYSLCNYGDGGQYQTGPNMGALTTTGTTGTPPCIGTAIISQSASDVVSGTFNFKTSDGTMILNGVFSNVTL